VGIVKLSGLKLEVVLLAFGLAAAAAFGAQAVVERYQVEGPLVRSARRVEGVRRVEMVRKAGRTDMVVTMGPTADFRGSYRQLAELREKAHGSDGGLVVVRDNRDSRLVRALYDLNFALQEGLATGRYVEMRTAVEQAAERLRLTRPYLWVEEGRIYVELRDDRSVLYAVLERGAAPGGDRVKEGGGSVG
jgi:hypothetical protein